MAKGRPPELLLDPDQPSPVVQAVARIDDRGRVQLPPKIVQGWLSTSRPGLALVTMMEPGKIRLYPWEEAGPKVVEKRRDLIKQVTTDPSVVEVLKALEDRYKRIQIPLGARPTLTSEMLTHLGVAPPIDVYIWRIEGFVEFLSTNYRKKELENEFPELGDLPP